MNYTQFVADFYTVFAPLLLGIAIGYRLLKGGKN